MNGDITLPQSDCLLSFFVCGRNEIWRITIVRNVRSAPNLRSVTLSVAVGQGFVGVVERVEPREVDGDFEWGLAVVAVARVGEPFETVLLPAPSWRLPRTPNCSSTTVISATSAIPAFLSYDPEAAALPDSARARVSEVPLKPR